MPVVARCPYRLPEVSVGIVGSRPCSPKGIRPFETGLAARRRGLSVLQAVDRCFNGPTMMVLVNDSDEPITNEHERLRSAQLSHFDIKDPSAAPTKIYRTAR